MLRGPCCNSSDSGVYAKPGWYVGCGKGSAPGSESGAVAGGAAVGGGAGAGGATDDGGVGYRETGCAGGTVGTGSLSGICVGGPAGSCAAYAWAWSGGDAGARAARFSTLGAAGVMGRGATGTLAPPNAASRAARR